MERDPATGMEIHIGGELGEKVGRTARDTDTFKAFVMERLTGNLRWRVVGVVLFVLGATLDLAINLLAI